MQDEKNNQTIYSSGEIPSNSVKGTISDDTEKLDETKLVEAYVTKEELKELLMLMLRYTSQDLSATEKIYQWLKSTKSATIPQMIIAFDRYMDERRRSLGQPIGYVRKKYNLPPRKEAKTNKNKRRINSRNQIPLKSDEEELPRQE